jgi:hypothetical protein
MEKLQMKAKVLKMLVLCILVIGAFGTRQHSMSKTILIDASEDIQG